MIRINTLKQTLLLMVLLLAGFSPSGWCEYRVELKPVSTGTMSLEPGINTKNVLATEAGFYDENGVSMSLDDLRSSGYTYCIEASITGGIQADTAQAYFGNALVSVGDHSGNILTTHCPEEMNFHTGSATYLRIPLVISWSGMEGNNELQHSIQGTLNATLNLIHNNQVVSTSSATQPFSIKSGLSTPISTSPKTMDKISLGSPVNFEFEVKAEGSPDAPDVSWELTSGPCDGWSPALSTKQLLTETIPPDGVQALKAEARISYPGQLSYYYPLTARFTPTEAGAFKCTAILTLAFP